MSQHMSGLQLGTGLSQPMSLLSAGHPPGLAGNAPQVSLPTMLLRDFVENEVLRHFSLVQASNTTASSDVQNLTVDFPKNWQDLKCILNKLALFPDSMNPWNSLGYGPLDGPEPDELGIAARTRCARTLCTLALDVEWDLADKKLASEASDKITAHGKACEEQLADVLRERRRLRPSRLPQWKELGTAAIQVLKGITAGRSIHIATQWSQLLPSDIPNLSDVVDKHRRLADLLEKGDEKALDSMGGAGLCGLGADRRERVEPHPLRVCAQARPHSPPQGHS